MPIAEALFGPDNCRSPHRTGIYHVVAAGRGLLFHSVGSLPNLLLAGVDLAGTAGILGVQDLCHFHFAADPVAGPGGEYLRSFRR